jgi:hypothetical protein
MIMSEADGSDRDDSPFQPPADSPSDGHRSTDPSVFAEPWMTPAIHLGIPGDPAGLESDSLPVTDADHSVWDEPGLSRSLSGDIPANAVTWFGHFLQQKQSTSMLSTWITTLTVAVLAGPLSIVGTLIQGTAAGGLIGVVVIGPTIEEVMKIALPVWLVEKRAWKFRSVSQILVCCFASGLAFAAIENLVYLRVHIANPTPGIIQWRWSVCVLLHASCSFIAGLGVARMWTQFQVARSQPDLKHAATAILTAIVLHGTYNATVTLLEVSGFAF